MLDGHNGLTGDERPSSRSAEETSQSKNAKSKAAPVDPVDPVPEAVKDHSPSEEAKIWLENPGLHWSDVMIKANKAQLVDLEE